jgi:hypothetical protein
MGDGNNAAKRGVADFSYRAWHRIEQDYPENGFGLNLQMWFNI